VSQSRDIILLRARHVDEHNQLFAEQLRQVSGCEVQFLVDERSSPVPSDDPLVLSLNNSSYDKLGLYVPPDVAWRCGDYGAYIAWRVDPTRSFYWIIEDDVRIDGDASEFFRLCATSNSDLLAPRVRKTERGDFWWPHTVSKNAVPHSCLFGAIRLSSKAVELSYEKRRSQSRKLNRIALWPNDEGLVATTVVANGLKATDFNEILPGLWDEATFSVTSQPISFNPVPGPPRLLHPVRFKPRPHDFAKQTNRDDASSLRFRIRQWIARRLNKLSSW
jgi:hypothetical protein